MAAPTALNILRPPLIWVGGRCYRKYPEIDSSGNADEIEETPIAMCQDESCDSHYEIEKQANGQFKTAVQVPSAFFGQIIGTKAMVKKRIEMETKTHIKVPKYGNEGDIVISGSSKNQVASARNRVELIVESARQKEPFTHFLSIPVTNIINNFLEFQSDVLQKCDGDRGIDKSIFQNPKKLHLTIGTMPLMDDNDRRKGSELLSEFMKNIPALLNNQPLKIIIQGIEYMNDDPAEVDVLYAKILPSEGSQKLQLIADQLVDTFVSSGLMQRQYERVKLHVTIMNTLFRKDSSGVTETNFQREHRTKMQRERFDATRILNIFQDFFFGEIQLENIQLCQRHGINKEGYYYFVAKFPLPS